MPLGQRITPTKMTRQGIESRIDTMIIMNNGKSQMCDWRRYATVASYGWSLGWKHARRHRRLASPESHQRGAETEGSKGKAMEIMSRGTMLGHRSLSCMVHSRSMPMITYSSSEVSSPNPNVATAFPSRLDDRMKDDQVVDCQAVPVMQG